MKIKNPVIHIALLLGLLSLRPLAVADDEPMHVAGGFPIVNPPKKIASKKPSAQDYNVLFRDFLGTELVDISKESIDPKLTELFSKESSNALYRRLKLKEKAYDGAILITPAAIEAQQIVVVAARIAYKQDLETIVRSEYLQIVFSKKGKFVEVRKSVPTMQDL